MNSVPGVMQLESKRGADGRTSPFCNKNQWVWLMVGVKSHSFHCTRLGMCHPSRHVTSTISFQHA